ncbi:MAG: hypothetical protein R2764_17225 [Bacteroidales bacterium]
MINSINSSIDLFQDKVRLIIIVDGLLTAPSAFSSGNNSEKSSGIL